MSNTGRTFSSDHVVSVAEHTLSSSVAFIYCLTFSWMVRLRASTVVCSSVFDALHVILAERKLYTDSRVKSQPSTWGCRRCWFPKIDPDPVGVAVGVAKTKVAYSLVFLVGIPVVSMACVQTWSSNKRKTFLCIIMYIDITNMSDTTFM